MFTQHFQYGHFYGKGVPAADRFEQTMQELFRHGKLTSVDKWELRDMIKKVHDEFGDASSFTEYDFYNKVCKPLGINPRDKVSGSDVEEVSEKLGMKSNRLKGRLDQLEKHDGETDEKDHED